MEQQITSNLFDGKGILRLSLFSLMESMRKDPQKYSKLIYYNRSLSAGNIDQYSTGYYCGIPRQQLYPSFHDFYEEYESTLLEEAEKLYNKSVKEWTEQIITKYSIKNSSSQVFKPDKELQQFHLFLLL